jgi:hypothetical protein
MLAGDRWKAKYSIPGPLRIARAPGRSRGRTGLCQTTRTVWPPGSHEFKYVKGCPANRSLPGSCTYLTTAA